MPEHFDYEVSLEGRSLIIDSFIPEVDDALPMHIIRLNETISLPEAITQIRSFHVSTDEHFLILTQDPYATWLAFLKMFQYLGAAGGLVFNKSNEVLLIHRHGIWDLPKGKIEPGENVEEAAIREVEEECGVHHLQIIQELKSTWHTYLFNGQFHIKRTHWFKMICSGNEKLVPQAEEGITEVRWMDRVEAESALATSYANIRKVFAQG